MKDPDNIKEVIGLNPQYLGFILYRGSPRYVSLDTAGELVKNIPLPVQKVGVIVNEPLENALQIAKSGIFDLLQLHGTESVDYCRKIGEYIRIIKSFPLFDTLPESLPEYGQFSDMFLFDTAGENYGGNGKMFDHKILNDYSVNMNYILSGGISPSDSTYIKSIVTDKMIGIDLNSRFEIRPGIKDVTLLKNFIEIIRKDDNTD